MSDQICPLCVSHQTVLFYEDKYKKYFRCQNCSLVFLNPSDRLSPDEEKARYEEHNNDSEDPGYREFLSRLFRPMKERLSRGLKGLDYGSGPGPTLSLMFEEEGHSMDIYDPYFAPNEKVFEKKYDFISCTESVEHFFEPAKEFMRFDRLLEEKGLLGVMTQPLVELEAFSTWYYRNDPTHVSFFSEDSLNWVAKKWNWKLENVSEGVYLFHKG